MMPCDPDSSSQPARECHSSSGFVASPSIVLQRFSPLLASSVLLTLVSAPAFAAANPATFDIRDLGAHGDGTTSDTDAINQAIARCSEAGGGQVLFPPGRYLSGTVHLRSHVTLFLEAGATLVGTTNLAEYYHPVPPASMPEAGWGKWHRGLIVGDGIEDVTIAGPGVIDGNKVFDPTGEERMRGPHSLVFVNCRNFTVRDVTFLDAANYAILFLVSDQVEVRNVRFVGGWDGVHFRGSPERDCRDVNIISCQFYTGDDSIAGRYWHNTLISGCVINSSCNGIRLIGPATKLVIHDSLFNGPGMQPHRTSGERRRTNMLSGIILQPGAWDATQGLLDDVLISDVTMHRVASPVTIWTKPGNSAGRITVSRLSATGVYRSALSVESYGDTPITNVVFRDVSLEFDGGGTLEDAKREVRGPGVDARLLPAWGVYARNVENLRLEDVRLSVATEDLRPVLAAEHVDRLLMDDFDYERPVEPPEDYQALRLKDVNRLVRNDQQTEDPPP